MNRNLPKKKISYFYPECDCIHNLKYCESCDSKEYYEYAVQRAKDCNHSFIHITGMSDKAECNKCGKQFYVSSRSGYGPGSRF